MRQKGEGTRGRGTGRETRRHRRERESLDKIFIKRKGESDGKREGREKAGGREGGRKNTSRKKMERQAGNLKERKRGERERERS